MSEPAPVTSVASSAPEPTAGTWRTTLAHSLVLAVVAVLLYLPVLRGRLDNFDDLRWLEDTQVRNSIETIFDPDLKSANMFATTYYLPLQSALYYGMVQAFDRDPRPYRALCIAIHVAAILLLYQLILSLGRRPHAAFIAALLFAGHKGNLQSVTWVSAAFSHPLATVFILATLLSFRRHLRTGGIGSYVAALFLFLVAILIRESAVIVPFLLFAMEVFIPPDPTPGTPRRWLTRWRDGPKWHALIKYAPFVLILVRLAFIYVDKYQGGTLKAEWGGASLDAHALYRLFDFITLDIVPWPQSPTTKLFLTAIVLLGSALLVYRWRRAPQAAFAVLWIVMGTAPFTISNFNNAHDLMRYLYLGLTGVIVLFAIGLSAWEDRFPKWRDAAYAVALATALGHIIVSAKAV